MYSTEDIPRLYAVDAGAWNSNENIPTGEINVKIMKYTFIFSPKIINPQTN